MDGLLFVPCAIPFGQCSSRYSKLGIFLYPNTTLNNLYLTCLVFHLGSHYAVYLPMLLEKKTDHFLSIYNFLLLLFNLHYFISVFFFFHRSYNWSGILFDCDAFLEGELPDILLLTTEYSPANAINFLLSNRKVSYICTVFSTHPVNCGRFLCSGFFQLKGN